MKTQRRIITTELRALNLCSRIAPKLRRCLQCLTGGVILACTLGTEAAQLVYFDENGGSGNPRGFYNFDTVTGVSTLRTTVPGSERFFAMDIRPSDGTVFAVSFSPTLGIFTINLDTGASSVVGLTGVSDLVGLAFNPATSQLFAQQNGGGLYSVNQATGEAMLIGDTGVVDRGLVFSPLGDLYGFTDRGALYRINPANGNVTPVGGTGNPVADPSIGISEDSAFTAAGQLFATDYAGTIFQTDPLTGNGAVIGSTGMGNGLLALSVTPVPEPATLTLLVCGAGIAAFAFRRTSRRP
jgi:hypothetical protein